MSEVRFYHLMRQSLEQALPVMLTRCLDRGWRALVLAGSAERVAHLDQHLWTYDDRGFLPHGTADDGDPAEQPVFLAVGDDPAAASANPNRARVLFLADGATAEPIDPFPLVCELFDGRDEAAVAAARGRWKRYRDQGHTLTYWQQTPRGAWEEKHRVDPAAGGPGAA